MPNQIRPAYEEELREWIKDGWLIPHPYKKLGPPKGLIPLMAVAQHNKAKVRPVVDYRELNAHIDAFTANADVCANKLREWRQLGSNVCLLDLRKAYLQVRVSETMWPFQTMWPYQTGLRAERGTPNNEDHRQRGVVTAGNNKRGDIGVPWWHIRERRHCVVITRKVPAGQVWSDLQEPRTFGGWHPCLGPERSTGAEDLEVGARNCSSWSTRYLHKTSCLLPVWKTCGSPTSVWMDSCGNRHHKKESKRSHQRLGRRNNGRSVGSHGEGDHHKGKAGWPCKRRVVLTGRRTECVGGCELFGNWCAVGEGWSCGWGRLLVATGEWRCSHQPGRAQCGDERRQPGTPVESQEITHTHWFAMRIPLDIGHADRQGQGAHQGSQRDADQTEAGDHKKAGDGIQSVCGCGTCHLKL